MTGPLLEMTATEFDEAIRDADLILATTCSSPVEMDRVMIQRLLLGIKSTTAEMEKWKKYSDELGAHLASVQREKEGLKESYEYTKQHLQKRIDRALEEIDTLRRFPMMDPATTNSTRSTG